jgi:hypothetical protein
MVAARLLDVIKLHRQDMIGVARSSSLKRRSAITPCAA